MERIFTKFFYLIQKKLKKDVLIYVAEDESFGILFRYFDDCFGIEYIQVKNIPQKEKSENFIDVQFVNFEELKFLGGKIDNHLIHEIKNYMFFDEQALELKISDLKKIIKIECYCINECRCNEYDDENISYEIRENFGFKHCKYGFGEMMIIVKKETFMNKLEEIYNSVV